MEICLCTDASQTGLVVHSEDQRMSGRWSSPDIDHINALEMRAIFLVVSHWASPPPPIPLWWDKKVLVRSDNVFTVQYINRQGGTISPRLCHLTIMWQIAVDNGIGLSAAHNKGETNVIVDSLSRGRDIPWSEWSLCPKVMSQISVCMGLRKSTCLH